MGSFSNCAVQVFKLAATLCLLLSLFINRTSGSKHVIPSRLCFCCLTTACFVPSGSCSGGTMLDFSEVVEVGLFVRSFRKI
jgi:hypothetical protein